MFSFKEEIPFNDKISNKLCVEEIDPELLENIRCPKCATYYFSPIYLCPKGHNLCNHCKEDPKFDAIVFGKTGDALSSNNTTTTFGSPRNMFVPPSRTQDPFSSQPSSSSGKVMVSGFGNSFCGKCNLYFTKNQARRTTAREKSIKILIFPCGNAHKKCSYRNNLLQINQHEKTCIYAPRSCFFDGCDWKDTTDNIINHIKEKHTFIVMNEPQILLEGINIYPLLYDSKFFILKTSYSSCEALRFSVLYPGEGNRYKFDILFMGYNEDIGIRLTNYCETLMNESVKSSDLFTDDIIVPFDCLKHFITDLQKLRFIINIIKIC